MSEASSNIQGWCKSNVAKPCPWCWRWKGHQAVRLVDTASESGRYIALSHCVRIESSNRFFLFLGYFPSWPSLDVRHSKRGFKLFPDFSSATVFSIVKFSKDCLLVHSKSVLKEGSPHVHSIIWNLLTLLRRLSGENQSDSSRPHLYWKIWKMGLKQKKPLPQFMMPYESLANSASATYGLTLFLLSKMTLETDRLSIHKWAKPIVIPFWR